MPIITLLTDFGTRDHFVGAMKGVMLKLNPALVFVDISHEIPPQDIYAGSYTLGNCCFYYPPGTIHLAVVDPGVGSARRALAVSAGGSFFVAPDNGLLTHVMQSCGGFVAHEITAEHYYNKPVAVTFHGRDVFAPIAAWISRGIPLSQLGPAVTNPVRLQLPEIKKVRDALIQGTIIAVDRFGNIVTNLKPEDVPRSFKLISGRTEVTVMRKTYGEGGPGEVFVVPGSTGYLEIAIRGGSAAEHLKLKAGDPVGVILS
ncbi:MAG TPA: SAM-dependent chlorinase/fluorinase [Acidobacteriota bacterium]|nr:SAM-dependent chlorinase/fluorinase [Acidobacteriota bacterium]